MIRCTSSFPPPARHPGNGVSSHAAPRRPERDPGAPIRIIHQQVVDADPDQARQLAFIAQVHRPCRAFETMMRKLALPLFRAVAVVKQPCTAARRRNGFRITARETTRIEARVPRRVPGPIRSAQTLQVICTRRKILGWWSSEPVPAQRPGREPQRHFRPAPPRFHQRAPVEGAQHRAAGEILIVDDAECRLQQGQPRLARRIEDRSLDLDDQHEARRSCLDQPDHFAQERDSLVGDRQDAIETNCVVTSRPGRADVVAPQLGQHQVGDSKPLVLAQPGAVIPATVSSIQHIVVVHDHLPVAGQIDIQLRTIRAQLDRVFEGRECVLDPQTCTATVGDQIHGQVPFNYVGNGGEKRGPSNAAYADFFLPPWV